MGHNYYGGYRLARAWHYPACRAGQLSHTERLTAGWRSADTADQEVRS
jgi:hypothetical protein